MSSDRALQPPDDVDAAAPDVRTAFHVAGGYAAIATAYFAISDSVAWTQSTSAADLTHVQILKNLSFVGISTVGLYLLTLHACRRFGSTIGRTTAKLRGAEDALVQSDRRAVVGTLAAGAAHDFRNLLTIVSSSAQLLDSMEDLPEDAKPIVKNLLDATDRGVEVAQSLMSAGRNLDFDSKEKRKLGDLVRKCVDVTRVHEHVKRCTLEVKTDDGVEAWVVGPLVTQAVMNLILNAAEASPRGRIELHVRRDGADALLEVHDDGPGIPPELLDRVFETYRTTKAAGSGLGLISVKACARLHGGRTHVERSPLGGALFQVRLPAA